MTLFTPGPFYEKWLVNFIEHCRRSARKKCESKGHHKKSLTVRVVVCLWMAWDRLDSAETREPYNILGRMHSKMLRFARFVPCWWNVAIYGLSTHFGEKLWFTHFCRHKIWVPRYQQLFCTPGIEYTLPTTKRFPKARDISWVQNSRDISRAEGNKWILCILFRSHIKSEDSQRYWCVFVKRKKINLKGKWKARTW